MENKIKGIVRPGYGVASGKNKDERYPEGTIKQQFKYFLERGLDLSCYFLGTVNLDISPYKFNYKKPKHFFENINWSDHIPPENFYFFDVSLHFQGKTFEGLIYMPDPKTKEDHIQRPSILELLLPKVNGLHYGQTVAIEVKEEQLEIFPI